ncbi:choice-of-anchor Q domain-containing protein [Desulfonema magnum]|uniref:Probable pectate lyase C n=1 Tax=Desulfonema magnum TaxID=45655 RepID=A0A975GNG8_9BACT|nr:choice-of-anchor Q domain-containing protein [Desulfonema magnum]QTA87956.1 pectin lyase fold-containing [Desulfonema magnum]
MKKKQHIRIAKSFIFVCGLAFLLSGLLNVMSVPLICAATITVANGNDSGAGSLRQAIAEAAPGDIINFNVGTVTLTSEQLTLNKNVTIDGSTGEVIIQRSSQPDTPDFRIFYINSGVTAQLKQIKVTNGKLSDGSDGGGIYADTAAVVLKNTTVTGNMVCNKNFNSDTGNYGANGAGIYVNSGTITLENTTVSSNTTGYEDTENTYYGGNGSGIYVNDGAVMLKNSAVTGNTTSKGNFNGGDSYDGGNGGGIYVDSAGVVTLENSAVTGNATGHGNYNRSSGDGGDGGGIYVNSQSAVMLENTTVSGNVTGRDSGYGGDGDGGSGAGICIYNGTVFLKNSVVSGNVTGDGGEIESDRGGGEGAGIYVNNGTATLKNSTVSGNITGNSAGNGGGIYVGNSTVTLENATVTANTGSMGGGLYILSQNHNVTLRNTILAGNTASDVRGPDCYGPLTSEDYNLIGNRSGCTAIFQENDLAGTSASPTDPKLASLANNGGPTQTHGLQSGSPAIDAGSCYDMAGNPAESDQRGYYRSGTRCDMGAFEYQGLSLKRIFVKPDALETGKGDSWNNAARLQDALAQADAKEIWVAAGTYTPDSGTGFQLRSGVAVYGGFDGTETFPDERDWETNLTTLRGNGSYAVTGSGVNNTAILDGFTVTSGVAGGIYNDAGSPTVTRCIFTGNTGTNGGGMFNNSSSPVMTHCVFSENSATNGGGIYNNAGSPVLTNCIFNGNTATNGGGIYNDASSPVLTNCIFNGNSATSYGGGMCNNTRSPRVANCTFYGNTASGGSGIYNISASPVITNSILWGNTGQIGNSSSSPGVTYSLVYDENPETVYPGTGNKNGDPLFADSAEGNFHLKPGSPAIDAGAGCSTPDMDGVTRPQAVHENACDMGAFEFTDQPPSVTSEIRDRIAFEDDPYIAIELTHVFTDPDNDPVTKSVVSNSNPDLLTAIISEDNNDILILDLLENQSGEAEIVIRGTSNLKYAEDTFTITVSLVSDPPTVANPIEDVEADEDGPNTIIDLSNVFTDVDSEDDAISKSVLPISNFSLVTATIDGNTLTLDYQKDQYGSADIVIEGSSKGLTVKDIFTVTVNPTDDPPVIANPIKDMVVNDHEGTTSVSLYTVFTDIDNEDLLIEKSVLSNSRPSLVSASIIGNTLTLDYQENQIGTAVISIQATSNEKTVTDTFTVTIRAIRATGFDKVINKKPPLTFSGTDFSRQFTGDTLNNVRITSLPANGTLKLSASNVKAGQQIPVSDLDNLTYYPNAGYYGQDSFRWNGSNDVGYAPEDAWVSLTVTIDAGDVDYNGSVDLRDAVLALQIMTGFTTGDVYMGADINADKRIGTEDVIQILLYIISNS